MVHAAQPAPDRPSLAIVGATVVDPGGATTPDATVLVVGSRIEAVHIVGIDPPTSILDEAREPGTHGTAFVR